MDAKEKTVMRDEFQNFRDCRRMGFKPVHCHRDANTHADFTRSYNTGVVGDIGVSVSAPQQAGSQAGAGNLTVGGGAKFGWLWPVAIVVVVVVVVVSWMKSKKDK